jgi:hypothetical protein
MSEHTPWVAFRSSAELHETTDAFIQRMRAGATRTETDTVERIMSLFMREVLHTFFIVPSEGAKLPSSTQKMIRLAVETISKASHLVIKSAARKLDIDQHRRAAEYMDSVRFMKEINGKEVWFVAFPLNEAIATKGRNAFTMGINGEGKKAVPALQEYFHQLTDISLHWYFEKPMDLLRFGPIIRKLAEVGVGTTRKASHSVIDKAIPGMTDEQLAVTCQFAQMQLVDGPKRTDI